MINLITIHQTYVLNTEEGLTVSATDLTLIVHGATLAEGGLLICVFFTIGSDY